MEHRPDMAPPTPDATVHVPERRIRSWTTRIFVAAGLCAQDAAVVSDNLVTADLRGVYSHGIMRVPAYLKRLETRATDPVGRPRIVRSDGSTALVDGDNAMGQVAGAFAMDDCIVRAAEHGIAMVGVRGSNHCGACAHFALMAIEREMVGIAATVGAKNIMAPWGGAKPLLGNNPFAVAIPTGDAPPVVLDMAMSVAAGGKIMLAAKRGQPIADDWALDAAGAPTTDPSAALQGSVRPLAQHKGYGLAFVTALLAAVLPGAAFGTDVTDLYTEFTRPQDVGHCMIAIDVSRFNDRARFRAAVDAAIGLMHEAPRAPGVDEILVPGEREAQVAEQQRVSGIAYSSAVLGEIERAAAQLQVESLS